ncbi:glycosyltransferase family 4 protein [Flavobacterium sp. ACN6]|uniref:glycosyltransferase family 4 protein n=1 Tax=Flavobacterium sp. ACN6 TaxID=1920426 RepID=UPI000BB2D554|nr:glycosyltransferase family 4 protein [Flavobacterium sp. ACN6]PBJ13835.1 Glycogen synthase [Flavobacterium sp. ACN6]
MNIGFLTPEFPHEKIAHAAGIGTSVKNLAGALSKKGCKITIFVYGQKTQEVISENGINIHLIENKKYNFFGWYFHRKYIQNYCNSVIEKDKIAVLEAPDWTGITAFMKFRIPLVIRFHGSDAYFCHLENRQQKIKNFWFEKLAINQADAFISPTKFAGELTKNLFKIKKQEIRTIHNGIDLSNFENAVPEQFEKNLILYIGTLIRKKGVLELPEIFNKVRNDFPDAKLVLIGGDSFDIKTGSKSTWELMKNSFKKEDLKYVSYLGKIPYHEIQNYLIKANVCVFPTFAETLGMVTLESMAMQKAVVNSNIGWSKELIVDEESGFLVHPSNHDLYGDRIKELFEDDLLTLQIGRAARKRMEEKFDINNLVSENIRFYQNIINSKKK